MLIQDAYLGSILNTLSLDFSTFSVMVTFGSIIDSCSCGGSQTVAQGGTHSSLVSLSLS